MDDKLQIMQQKFPMYKESDQAEMERQEKICDVLLDRIDQKKLQHTSQNNSNDDYVYDLYRYDPNDNDYQEYGAVRGNFSWVSQLIEDNRERPIGYQRDTSSEGEVDYPEDRTEDEETGEDAFLRDWHGGHTSDDTENDEYDEGDEEHAYGNIKLMRKIFRQQRRGIILTSEEEDDTSDSEMGIMEYRERMRPDWGTSLAPPRPTSQFKPNW